VRGQAAHLQEKKRGIAQLKGVNREQCTADDPYQVQPAAG